MNGFLNTADEASSAYIRMTSTRLFISKHVTPFSFFLPLQYLGSQYPSRYQLASPFS